MGGYVYNNLKEFVVDLSGSSDVTLNLDAAGKELKFEIEKILTRKVCEN